jgi:APA family basic amino acid/polyamine antiporter
MSGIVGEGAVGFAAGHAIFGDKGSKVVAAIMLASVFGTVNANVLVGPRIAYAMASDRLFFEFAAKLNSKGTPHISVILQGIVATILVVALNTDLDKVLQYTTFAIVLATIADTIALYVLRSKMPDTPRPYRAQGYPWLPAVYVVANVGIAISMLLSKPLVCLASLGVLLAGVPFYLMFVAVSRRRAQ